MFYHHRFLLIQACRSLQTPKNVNFDSKFSILSPHIVKLTLLPLTRSPITFIKKFLGKVVPVQCLYLTFCKHGLGNPFKWQEINNSKVKSLKTSHKLWFLMIFMTFGFNIIYITFLVKNLSFGDFFSITGLHWLTDRHQSQIRL